MLAPMRNSTTAWSSPETTSAADSLNPARLRIDGWFGAVRTRTIVRLAPLIVAAAIAAASASPARGAPPDPERFGIAIELGDRRSARVWLDEGLDPDFMADRIGSGLMIAAWEGDIPMMELFLERGADIDRTNALDEQALMHAAWKGRIEAVRWLLDHGARVNRDGLRWSALHYAVFAGNADVARLLIERGADVSARSPNGSTVLMMAAREGHDELAKLLVERGADTTASNEMGEDAAAWAIRHGHYGIARLVSSRERLADAARNRADEPPAAVHSIPAPARMDELMRAMRIAQAEGRPIDELRRAYLQAFDELFRQPPAVTAEEPPLPEALEITAARGKPGREKATVVYRAAKRPAAAAKPKKRNRKASPKP